MSVNRLSPVAVVNDMKAIPSGPSESKSMISRWKSSVVAPGWTAFLKAKVESGAEVSEGLNPKFRLIQALLAIMSILPV